MISLWVAEGKDHRVETTSGLGKEDWKLRGEWVHNLDVPKHSDGVDDSVGGPCAEPQHDVGQGHLGDAHLCTLSLFILSKKEDHLVSLEK